METRQNPTPLIHVLLKAYGVLGDPTSHQIFGYSSTWLCIGSTIFPYPSLLLSCPYPAPIAECSGNYENRLSQVQFVPWIWGASGHQKRHLPHFHIQCKSLESSAAFFLYVWPLSHLSCGKEDSGIGDSSPGKSICAFSNVRWFTHCCPYPFPGPLLARKVVGEALLRNPEWRDSDEVALKQAHTPGSAKGKQFRNCPLHQLLR